ncbi:MAG TPA: citramalate synthase [Opitutales bacterium]|nr:citramalate synthase [Opitutales bacterium]
MSTSPSPAETPGLVLVYDTTLRDGTQGEGVAFSVAAKLRLVEKLDEFGVDYIEGGWPGSNPRDQEFFEQARGLKLRQAKLASFGSTRRAQTPVAEDAQVRLLLDAQTPVVTIFGKSWLLHVTEVLRTTPEENLAMIGDTVRHLVQNGREVIYDAEHFFDGYKNNPEYALKTLAAAHEAGAGCLTLCDTNGGSLVPEVRDITAEVVRRFSKARVGLHCHNDAGLGVAVTLAGVEAGGTLVQGTLNGYGERNGNANLTTVLPNLALKMGRTLHCGKNLGGLRDLSHFTDELANFRPDPKAPYVGASAFAHKGGVHADAANKVARSYEHIDPALVGNHTRVLVSDMSGRSSVMMKARELGLDLDARSPKLKDFLAEVKAREFRGYQYEAADASFLLLLKKFLEGWREPFDVLGYRVMVEREGTSEMLSEATVKVQNGQDVRHEVAEDTGPVGALDRALRKALEPRFPALHDVHLSDFNVRIVDTGQGAQAVIRVLVESTDGHESWGTVGASANIMEASYEALCDSYAYKLLRDAGRK